MVIGRMLGEVPEGVSAIAQMQDPHLVDRISSFGLMRVRTPRDRSTRYRGVFDIEGNANAWSGLSCTLLGASCVLKVASPRGFRQWYYHELRPSHHFIPIQSDFSDLTEAVQWFAAHASQARDIATRGREMAVAMDIESAVRASAFNLKRLCERQA